MPHQSEPAPQLAVLDPDLALGRRDRRARRERGQPWHGAGGGARRPTLVVLLPTLLLALWAAWWVIDGTREFTSEIQNDSAVYLSTGEGLRDHGLPTVAFNLNWDHLTPKEAVAFDGRIPSTVYPPGYPAALAATSVVTGNVRSAARTVDVILIVVNLLLIAWLTARMTANRSVVVATIPAVLLLFDTDVRRVFFTPLFGWMQLHRAVASEPLFMAFTMVGLLALHAALSASASERGRRALMIAAGAAAGALLVRYVIAFILAAVIALVIFDRQRALRSRLRRAAIFTAVAAAPTALFIAWARLDGGQNPTSSFYQQSVSVLAPLDRLADYALPPGGPHAVRLLAVAILLGLCIIGAVWGPGLPGTSAEDDGSARLLVQLGLLHLGVYVLFIMTTATLFDLAVPMDARIFAPIRGLWYAVLLAVAYRSLVRVASGVGAVAILGALAALLVIANWSHTQPMLDEGATRPYARTSVSEAISRIPKDALIVSNAPGNVYALTGRGSIVLPFRTGAPTPEYDREIRQVVELLNSRGGYVALSAFPSSPLSIPPELQRLFEFRLIAQGPARKPTAQLYEVLPQASTSGAAVSGR